MTNLLASIVVAVSLHIDNIKVDTVNRGYATVITLQVSGCQPNARYIVEGRRNGSSTWITEACFGTTTNQTSTTVAFVYPSSYGVSNAIYRVKQRF